MEILLLLQQKELNDQLVNLSLLKLREQIRTRNDLNNNAIPKPEQSSWTYLYKNGNDESFINSIGINRQAFEYLLSKFSKRFRHKYQCGKGGRPSKLSTTQSLGMLLEFYASPSELKQIAKLHGLRKNTAWRILKKAEIALNEVLRKIPEARISWPSKMKQKEWAQLINSKYGLIKTSFGFVDGKNYRVQEPNDIDLQNAMYNGWLHAVLITGVLCFGVDGTIIWAKHNCVGSWNDGDMSRELQEKLMDESLMEEHHGIVSDTAFPVGKHLINRIISPLKENELESAHPSAQLALLSLSNEITSLRQACEWGVGSVEKAWRQLLLPLPYNPEVRRVRLSNIFRLWNFRVRTTNISQIRNTFC